MLYDFISIITPLLLHMLLSEAVVFFAGNAADATTCTALTALLVIPAALWMCRADRKKQKIRKDGAAMSETRRPRGAAAIGFGAAALFGGAALNLLWSSILNALRIGEHFSNQTQEALLAAGALIQVVGLGILVPVAEELIFRALIYRRMKRLVPLWAAALLSSLLFAFYHGNMIQIIFAFPMSLVLIWVYERGGSLIFPVLFHAGANLAAVFLNLAA